MKKIILILIILAIICITIGKLSITFNPELDFISLHYDHASDRDDGQSAVADRTILQSLFGKDWMRLHTIPVSGTCGIQCNTFVNKSKYVMNAVWGHRWLDARYNRLKTVKKLTNLWIKTLNAGGDIWVKEGGQADVTAMIVAKIKNKTNFKTKKRIHVIQHSEWNENHATFKSLEYVKLNTDYIKIPDQNLYFQSFYNNNEFVTAALNDSTFGSLWRVAFDYLNPNDKVDFSDTGELIYILNLKVKNIKAFRYMFFQ